MERSTYKKMQNLMLFFTILVLVSAFYIEYIYNLQPCPLCLMQRFCIFIIGFFCLVGFGLSSMLRARIIAFLQIILACLGVYFASRQLWLQSLPAVDGKMCMPGVDALMSYFSATEIMKAFFWGSTNCSDISWVGFGFSMPFWALIYFSIIALVNIFIFIFIQLRLCKGNK